MASRHRNVVNTQVALVAAAQLEYLLLLSGLDDMDDPACILFLTQTLQNQVVALRPFIIN